MSSFSATRRGTAAAWSAIVFDEPHHVAVFDVAKLAAGDITFGVNSWRGDQYETTLRKAIESFNSQGD